MNLQTLKNALACYAKSAECTEIDNVLTALADCVATEERTANKDIWHDEVCIISAWTLDNMLNQLAYDVYGKLKRIQNDNMQFSYFAHDCRKDCAMEELTDAQLQLGYGIIADLWSDNEAEGNHNIDGTFNHN